MFYVSVLVWTTIDMYPGLIICLITWDLEVSLLPATTANSSFSHSPGGKKKVHPPWHKEFSQEIPGSPATSSTLPTCLSVRDTWCSIWRPQIGQLFRTQGFYSQSGPEPGSRIDSEKWSSWGFSPCHWEGSCCQCAPWHCSCHCGEDIFNAWPGKELSLEPHCLGKSRALITI